MNTEDIKKFIEGYKIGAKISKRLNWETCVSVCDDILDFFETEEGEIGGKE